VRASPLNVPAASWRLEGEFEMFGDAVGQFCERELVPNWERWSKQGCVDRDIWRKAAEAGILMASTPAEFGGAGGDFRHEAVIIEQFGRRGLDNFAVTLQNAIVGPYLNHFASEAQKRSILPRMASGDLIGAIAMTEPGAGSDLKNIKATARRDGGHYVINGQKTFITSGMSANMILVCVKTDSTAGARGISLVIVETDEVQGFSRGRKLDKIGQSAQDTGELFFNDVRVPVSTLLGPKEGDGFGQLMAMLPQERHIIGLQAISMIERALSETIAYVKERKAFGGTLLDFQNTQFKLAEAKTEATVGKIFAEHCTERLLRGELDAATASMSKYWLSDLQCKIVDDCLQLFGGYGYMNEYPIAQMYKDARIQRIYGGANEVMKVLIARTL
jgi:acyl-CoA dehydrogenase